MGSNLNSVVDYARKLETISGGAITFLNKATEYRNYRTIERRKANNAGVIHWAISRQDKPSSVVSLANRDDYIRFTNGLTAVMDAITSINIVIGGHQWTCPVSRSVIGNEISYLVDVGRLIYSIKWSPEPKSKASNHSSHFVSCILPDNHLSAVCFYVSIQIIEAGFLDYFRTCFEISPADEPSICFQ